MLLVDVTLERGVVIGDLGEGDDVVLPDEQVCISKCNGGAGLIVFHDQIDWVAIEIPRLRWRHPPTLQEPSRLVACDPVQEQMNPRPVTEIGEPLVVWPRRDIDPPQSQVVDPGNRSLIRGERRRDGVSSPKP